MNAWQALLAIAMIGAGFCIYYWVPMGDPGKCRIIRKNGKETGNVRDTGGFVLPFNGWLTDFVEADKQFTVEVPAFEVTFPNEDVASTSLALLFEIASDGGAKFVKNGQQVGTTARSIRIAKTSVERFAQSNDEEPQSANEAQRLYKEFVLRVADALVKEDLLALADRAPNREEFLEDLVITLGENDGDYSVPQFGLRLVGLNMAQFVEPTIVAAAAAEKKAAKLKNEKDLAEIAAITEQRNKLTEGFPGVSFKEADGALAVWKKVVPLSRSEHTVRVEADENVGAAEKLIAGVIATFQEKNKNGGKK